ncbi:hypothetical protein [Bradyrhizobium sp. USDA 4350]
MAWQMLRNYFRSAVRAANLIAYGLSILIFHSLQPVAAKAYNDLCASQGMMFGEGQSVRTLVLAMIVIAMPVLLARSKTLVVSNLIMGLITVAGASGLLSTAGDTPYECFTTSGTYEDHTSGLDGFGFWFIFVLAVSYVLLLVDWGIWASRMAIAKWWPMIKEANVKVD